MELPADQHLLYQDLCTKLKGIGDKVQLVAFMGAVLRSLLRRKGDGEFLEAIQDAFTTGLAGRTWDDQQALAREIIGLVIAKRPEIARAWQALNPEAPKFQRRDADIHPAAPTPKVRPEDQLPDFDLIVDEVPDPPPPPYEFDHAEGLVAEYVSGVLERRLSVFTLPGTPFPATSYYHEQPLFLFAPAFHPVARRFFAQILVPLCRDALERHVYRKMDPATAADDTKLKDFLGEARPQMWKILMERLTKLATAHRGAEAKLEAALKDDGREPEYRIVEVPVTQPRVFRVLGVGFQVGSRTTLARKKVRMKADTTPTPDELAALELITRFRDMGAHAGLDLPDSCDFQLLRILFEFDAKKFAATMRDFNALCAHQETSRKFLFERLVDFNERWPAVLADALVISGFHAAQPVGPFGFKELYEICVGTDKDAGALAAKRPFLQDEICRRPRDLAFQVRECLKRRYDKPTLRTAVIMLMEVWKAMSPARFRTQLDAALTVFAAFPVAFAGDSDEETLTHIGTALMRELQAETIETHKAADRVVWEFTKLEASWRRQGIERGKRV